jgi:hypothetical protein
MLVHEYFRSAEYARLSPRAVKALVDLYTQFRGGNNGDLCAAWKIMAPLGWSSKDQLAKALQELLDAGWILITRMGGKRVARLYAVTWLGIDYCDGKLDVKPNPVPSMAWRQPAKVICLSRPTGQSVPPHGSKVATEDELCPTPRVNGKRFGRSFDPPHGTLLRSMPSGEQFERGLEQWETDGGPAVQDHATAGGAPAQHGGRSQ